MLGSVAIDIHKREREYKDLTLSDENVVKYLILFRNKVDVSYGANTNINIDSAGDTFEFNQELISLYASLDMLIRQANLKDKESQFLNWIFEGNTISDIVEEYGWVRRTAYNTLDRIVEKIVDENSECWNRVMLMNNYVTID